MRDDRQRIDKWLWHARLVRTRSAAAALAASGHVRLNGARIAAPAKPVKPGDVVTIALDARVRVLKVTGFAPRRGAAEAGRALYEDLSPADPARTEIVGNYRFDYKANPIRCDGYPWFDRILVRSHTEIECDPRVWSQVESLIYSKLSPEAPNTAAK